LPFPLTIYCQGKWRFKLQLKFLIRRLKKKLVTDADVLFPCQELSFLINLGGKKGGRDRKERRREKEKENRTVGRLKVTSSRVTITLLLLHRKP